MRVGEAGGEVRQPAQHVALQLADVIVGARCWVVQLVIGDGADNPSEVGEHRIQQFSRGVPWGGHGNGFTGCSMRAEPLS